MSEETRRQGVEEARGLWNGDVDVPHKGSDMVRGVKTLCPSPHRRKQTLEPYNHTAVLTSLPMRYTGARRVLFALHQQVFGLADDFQRRIEVGGAVVRAGVRVEEREAMLVKRLCWGD
ncbi:unnamed protein product [Gadus morhua 'NCC']